jgi:nitrite reductase/ring-hydroxylating ferredoxin subunit
MGMLKRVLILFFLFGSITGCKKESTPANSGVPNVSVNFSIPVNGGGYTNLLTIGGSVYINKGTGYDGLILFCNGQGSYLAFDRGCPYDCETNNNAVVNIQANGITAVCPVCSTTYSLYSGTRTGGQGSVALKQYQTSFDPTTYLLTVQN